MGNTTGSRKKKAIRGAWKLGMVLAGNTLYALGVTLFLLPSGLITGGTTGLGLVAQRQSTAQLATRWLSLPSSQGIIEEKGMPSPCSYRYDFPGRQST